MSTFHKIQPKYGDPYWLMLLKPFEYYKIAAQVASKLFAQTLGDPHWCADYDKGNARAVITHPFNLYPKHQTLFDKLTKRDGAVYINKQGGLIPLNNAEKVLEQSECEYWPSEEIKGSISKWSNGQHWYVKAEGVNILKHHKYKEKFNTIESAKQFLSYYMPDSQISVHDNFRYSTIGD